MTVGPDCANAVDHSVEDFAHAYGQRTSLYDAFIEWQGLLRVKRFLRSTFSQVLAVHREIISEMRCAHFIQKFYACNQLVGSLLG